MKLTRGFWLSFVFVVTASTAAWAGVEVEAIGGKPFGVGRIRVTPERPTRQPVDVPYEVEAADGRVFYPAFFREGRPGIADAEIVTARGSYFLFRGDAPLEISFHDGVTTTTKTATVAQNDEAFQRLLREWWERYQQPLDRPEGAPLVENYTTAMLARRLGLERRPARPVYPWSQDQILGAFLGFEEMRLAMQADRMLKDGERVEPADRPLPAPLSLPAIVIPEFEPPPVERLAAHIPEECFELRFGTYDNYRWFRSRLTRWGGNLRDITTTSSLDYQIQERLERQLVLRDSEIARVLGPTAIADMALIGMDPFVREGAAIGVLFEERAPGVLEGAIRLQRTAALNSDPLIREEALDIGGIQASVLTAPGNRVRSYYLIDRGFHLVTNSSTLARRFVEAGRGERALAALREFQYARTKHRFDQGSPVLLYLSDPFFRQLVGPAYRVEMTRRMRAEADVELVSLARLAALGEGAPHASVEELVDGKFLPPKFGKRPDETIPLIVNGEVVDSLRGARRSFLPIADVLVAGLTKSEEEAFAEFSRNYLGLYRRMDPVSLRLTRDTIGDKTERIVAELSVTPFTRQSLGAIANWLQPPSTETVSMGSHTLVSVEAGLQKTRAYAGVLDFAPQFHVHGGRVVISHSESQRFPGFVGEHGQRLLQSFLGSGPSKDLGDGYTVRESPMGSLRKLFSRSAEPWWIMSPSEAAVREVAPSLAITTAQRAAQIRMRVGNIGASHVAPLVRAGHFQADCAASRGNAELLNSLMQQLHVSGEKTSEVARGVIGALPVCPLGGVYQREATDFQFTTHQPWYSSAWIQKLPPWEKPSFPEQIALSRLTEIPEGYQPRLLNWFQGLDIEIQFSGDTMFTRTQLDIAREE